MSRRFRPGIYELNDNSSEFSSSSFVNEESSNDMSSSISSSYSTIISESIVMTKGGHRKKKFEINMDQLHELISDLRDYSDEKIHRLKGTIKTKYDQLKELVDLLYDTNSYSILVDIVTDHFSDIETVIPGTVGSYCIGCKYNNDSSIDDHCAPTCAGSMPLDQDGNRCKETVILAEYHNGSYNFSLLREASQSNSSSSEFNESYSSSYKTEVQVSGYVFVPHKNIEDFKGFSKKEKRNLIRMGIDHVKLYGYDDDESYGTHYKLGSSHIHEIKERRNRRNKTKTHDNNQFDYTLVMFVILIIIFIAVFLLSNQMRYGRL